MAIQLRRAVETSTEQSVAREDGGEVEEITLVGLEAACAERIPGFKVNGPADDGVANVPIE
ncbi:MAG: hypothetical protein HY547_06380 [Elusimicrobia bacterium]|nr:hypothetical protein [Elusimicrobiota bacterium]